MKKYRIVEQRHRSAKKTEFFLYKRLPLLKRINNVVMFLIGAVIIIAIAPILLIRNPSLFKSFPSIREWAGCLLWREIDVFYTFDEATEKINKMEKEDGVYWS